MIVLVKDAEEEGTTPFAELGRDFILRLLEVRGKSLRNDLQRVCHCTHPAQLAASFLRASGSGSGMNLGLNYHRAAVPAASPVSLSASVLSTLICPISKYFAFFTLQCFLNTTSPLCPSLVVLGSPASLVTLTVNI